MDQRETTNEAGETDQPDQPKKRWAQIASVFLVAILAAVPKAIREHQGGEADVPSRPLSQWHEFTSESGRFSVLLPGKPMQSEEDLAIAGFEITQHSARAASTLAIHGVMYFDVPAGLASLVDNNIEGALDGSRDGWLAETGAVLSSEYEVAIGRHPGRDMTADVVLENGLAMSLRARVYIADSRVFLLQVAARQGKVPNDDVLRFFLSFQVQESISK
jgi:hypothetical protein